MPDFASRFLAGFGSVVPFTDDDFKLVTTEYRVAHNEVPIIVPNLNSLI